MDILDLMSEEDTQNIIMKMHSTKKKAEKQE